MKNIDKWNYYNDLIEAREKAFIEKTITEIPKAFYVVLPNGKFRTETVTGVRYSNKKYFGFNKVPTKQAVEAIKSFAEAPYEFDKNNIYFGYEYIDGNHKCSGAYNIKDIEKQCTSLKEAENKAKLIQQKNEEESKLLAAGTHLTCSYCHKVFPKEQKVIHKIFGRDRKPVWNSWKNRWDNKAYVTEQYMDFCSGQCAGNEQMSREG